MLGKNIFFKLFHSQTIITMYVFNEGIAEIHSQTYVPIQIEW